MEIRTVPGGSAGCLVARIMLWRIDFSANRVGFADLISPPAPRGIGIHGDPWRNGDAVFAGGEGTALDGGAEAAAGGAGCDHGNDEGAQGDKADGAAPGGRHGMRYSENGNTQAEG